MTPEIVAAHDVVDGALERFVDALGADFERYRNHVYRGLNYQRQLLAIDDVPPDMALAWAVHDIGVWTSGWDYLRPSVVHLEELAPDFGIENPRRATDMVELHHKLRWCPDLWTETFRRADLVDVSRGALRSGLARTWVHDVVAAFPYQGFHGLLLHTAAGWARKHPLNPLPMLRW